jgi:RND family efflux transporter MFP subunit
VNPLLRQPAAIALTVLLLCGCSQQIPPFASVPRPVKVEVVSNRTDTGSASIVGTLRARQRSELGFESAGRIATLLVDVGDHVRAGQVLARLEESPAQWRLDKAVADRAAAAASFAERASQLKQQESLAQDQIISPMALESAQTQQRIAASQLQAADAALALARRELALSRITAPFDGEIVARSVQPHTDIGAGQPVLQIENGQTMEVMAMLPESVAAVIAPGQAASATVTVPGQRARTLPLTLDRLSARNESGSLVQAVFQVGGPVSGLRSGGVVSLELPARATTALSVPAAALLPGTEPGAGSVFVLDAARQQLTRRPIKLGDGLLPSGRIPVASGLAAGDQVVVAGAAFLTDGQAAIRHESQTLLHGVAP